MRIILNLLPLLLSSAASDLSHYDKITCPSDWRACPESRTCFKLFTGLRVNFWQSEELCAKHGGHVFSMTSDAEVKLVEDMTKRGRRINVDDMPFIGLYEKKKDCIWTWIDGSLPDLSYVNYQAGEPSSCTRNEDCNMLVTDELTGPPRWWKPQLLNDLPCRWIKHQALCKKKAEIVCKPGFEKVEETNTCERVCEHGHRRSGRNCVRDETAEEKAERQEAQVMTCPDGWRTFNGSKHCYKLFTGLRVNFWQSEELCVKHGGHVFSITSAEESKFIEGMTKRGGRIRAFDMPYIGLYAKKKDCIWTWIDGSLPDLSYVNYEPREPSDCVRNEQCNMLVTDFIIGGPLFKPQLLNDLPCQTPIGQALCKKPAVLTCKEGWHLEKETCIETFSCPIGQKRVGQTKTCVVKVVRNGKQVRSFESLLKEKCESLPYPSYFCEDELICYVGTSYNCRSVQYPAPSFFHSIDKVKQVIRKYKLAKSAYEVCTYKTEFKCRRGANFGNQCLWLTEKAQTWSEASNLCQKENGNLFVPHNDEDMKNALEFLNSSSTAKSGVWLGLIYSDKWIALDIYMTDYFRWKPVETNDNSNSASLFLTQTVSTTEGSYAAYMRSENIENRYVGLCASSPNL